MNWINPPPSVRRFSIHQLAQHWIAACVAAFLCATAVLSIVPGTPGWKSLHADTALAGAAVLLYHLLTLVSIGIRHNVPPEKLAFLPSAAEWGVLRGNREARFDPWKYSPEEKGDYLCIIAWSLLVAASGIFLRWPGRLGVPGHSAFGWLKAVHAGFGAGLAVHVLVFHVPGRWLRASSAFRLSIFKGTLPLAAAESRAGWIADLVAAGTLVPAPEEAREEDATETRQVRDLLDEGNLLAKEGKYADACRAFESALGLLPSYSQARFNLAVARMKEGRPDLAAAQFREFIAGDPFNPMAEKARELLESISGERGGGTP